MEFSQVLKLNNHILANETDDSAFPYMNNSIHENKVSLPVYLVLFLAMTEMFFEHYNKILFYIPFYKAKNNFA